MAYNAGINDLEVNRWTGTDPEDGLPAQIKFWREHYTPPEDAAELAEFNEFVRREGLEEMTTEIEYRTLDTTDKLNIREGDRVTFSRAGCEHWGEVTGRVYEDHEKLYVASHAIGALQVVIHKVERPVTALPTKPGLYTVAPEGAALESFRVFSLHRNGYWSENGDYPRENHYLDEDHYLFEYVADGTWILRRLVVEED